MARLLQREREIAIALTRAEYNNKFLIEIPPCNYFLFIFCNFLAKSYQHNNNSTTKNSYLIPQMGSNNVSSLKIKASSTSTCTSSLKICNVFTCLCSSSHKICTSRYINMYLEPQNMCLEVHNMCLEPLNMCLEVHKYVPRAAKYVPRGTYFVKRGTYFVGQHEKSAKTVIFL